MSVLSFPNPVNESRSGGGRRGGAHRPDAVLAAATLESVFALCVGCKLFSLGMRVGLVPAATCAACEGIWSSPRMAMADN